MDVAVLGAAHGHVGYALAEVSARPGTRLVGVVEPDPEFRRRFLPGVDAPVYESAEDLFAEHDVDVAVVAGVYSTRAAIAVTALGAGAHVLADKPLCLSVQDLDDVAEAAGRAQRHVSIMFEKRFYPTTLALSRLMADGVIGTPCLIASTGPHKLLQDNRPGWFLDPKRYGGIAADLPIHDIDLVLAISGAASGQVSAFTGNAGAADHPGFDDHVAVQLRAGGVIATIEANWLAPEASEVHGHYRMRVTGTEGTAELDWAYNRLTVTTHDRQKWEEPLPEALRPAQYFFDAIETGATPVIGTDESLLATRVALLAQESARRGGTQIQW